MKTVDDGFKEYIELKLKEHLHMIPSHMHNSVLSYVLHRTEPGSFLYAVLSNNLKGAVVNSDHINKAALVSWAEFCMWYLPASCWGSEQRVEDWLNPPDYSGDEGGVT